MTALETTRRADPEFDGNPADPSDLHADLDSALRAVLAVGALLVLMLPAARGHHDALGWLPLWLVGMPALAWWALHRFRLPGWARSGEPAVALPARRRRRGAVQARRRARPASPARPLPRVA